MTKPTGPISILVAERFSSALQHFKQLVSPVLDHSGDPLGLLHVQRRGAGGIEMRDFRPVKRASCLHSFGGIRQRGYRPQTTTLFGYGIC